MSTPTTTARRAREIALESIQTGGNVRELDAEHVQALAGSMKLRGLIVPVAVRPLDDHSKRFALVAGEHRVAAAREMAVDGGAGHAEEIRVCWTCARPRRRAAERGWPAPRSAWVAGRPCVRVNARRRARHACWR